MEKQKWFNQEVEEVEKNLQVKPEEGLNDDQVKERKEKYGLNELQAAKKETLFQKFLNQFKDFSIIILI